MKIFLVQDGEPEGPFTEEEIRAQLKSGELDAGTFATGEGMSEWKPVTEVLPLAEPSPSLATTAAEPLEPVVAPEADELNDDPDVRRYEPEHEERLRTYGWLAVGGLYLLAFFWPTPLAGGWGVVNLKFGAATEFLPGTIIPLMLWPAIAGLAVGAAGFLLKGRWRGVAGLFLCVIPLVLMLVLGGDGFVKIMDAMQQMSGAGSPGEAAKKGASGLIGGLFGLGAAFLLAWVVLAGVLSTIYFAMLGIPHGVRHLRPNNSKAAYFGIVAGVILILIQLVGFIMTLLSLFGGILVGLMMIIGMGLQIASVIVAFANTPSRLPKPAAKRALWGMGLAGGGVAFMLLALLVGGILDGGIQATLSMYLFKLGLWYTAAALVFPLAVLDLWLGNAADTPQNN